MVAFITCHCSKKPKTKKKKKSVLCLFVACKKWTLNNWICAFSECSKFQGPMDYLSLDQLLKTMLPLVCICLHGDFSHIAPLPLGLTSAFLFHDKEIKRNHIFYLFLRSSNFLIHHTICYRKFHIFVEGILVGVP